jgi:hypothetical protein
VSVRRLKLRGTTTAIEREKDELRIGVRQVRGRWLGWSGTLRFVGASLVRGRDTWSNTEAALPGAGWELSKVEFDGIQARFLLSQMIGPGTSEDLVFTVYCREMHLRLRPSLLATLSVWEKF